MQVVTKVEHGEGPFCKSNFTVSFFVPFGDQVAPCLQSPDSRYNATWHDSSNTSYMPMWMSPFYEM